MLVYFAKTRNHGLEVPCAATHGSAGLDLRADIGVDHSLIINPGKTVKIPTGWRIGIPPYHVGLVCPRSGLAAKHGITVLNAPGVIDSDYTGEVQVLLHNTGDKPFIVMHGDRIAQLVVVPVSCYPSIEVSELAATVRGEGGFGSTGVAA